MKTYIAIQKPLPEICEDSFRNCFPMFEAGFQAVLSKSHGRTVQRTVGEAKDARHQFDNT